MKLYIIIHKIDIFYVQLYIYNYIKYVHIYIYITFFHGYSINENNASQKHVENNTFQYRF